MKWVKFYPLFCFMLDRLNDIIQPIIKEENAELVDLIYRNESGRRILRLLVDKEGGITMEDCVKINERISQALDEADIINEKFFLEVNSPGLDRPFKNKRDYEKAVGRLVRVTLNAKIPDKMEYIAILKEVLEDSIKIDVKKKGIIEIPFGNIVRARQEIEL
ncbi:MAG: ribosome maturation factor RimP [Candidatus Omnitrophota bacterium]